MAVKLSTESMIRLGFGLSLGCLIWTSLSAYRSAVQSAEAVRQEQDSTRVLGLLRNTLTAALDTQMATRGYALSGEDAFLESFNAEKTNLPAWLDQLRAETGDDPPQRKVADDLLPLTTRLIQVCSRQISARQSGGIDRTTRLGIAAEESAVMDSIRDKMDAMQREEQTRVASRVAETRDSAAHTQRIAVWGGTMALLAAGAASFLAHLDSTKRRRVEAALREAEERTRLMLAGIQDYAIYMMDPKGRVVSWNSGAERINGYRADEVIGHHFSKFFPPGDVAQGRPDQALADAAAKGRFEEEAVRQRKGGTEFWASVIITPVRDERGSLRGYVKVTRDVTERRRNEQRFQGMLESVPDAIVVADGNGRIVMANGQTARLFGWAAQELTGLNVEALIPQRFRDGQAGNQLRLFGQAEPRMMGLGREFYGLRKDGTEFPVEIGLSPMETEEGLLVCSAFRDVTERKRAEREIAALNKNLRLRAAELEESNQELEAFSYSVSHDLRAPLRHIQGFVARLEKNSGPVLDDRSARFLNIISHSARQMGELIDALLLFSRTGRVALEPEPVDLEAMTREIIATLQTESPERHLTWHVAPLPRVRVDPSLLRQALINLLANAVKYTRPRDPAIIEVGCDDRDPAEHVIFIRDNGVGFEMEYVHKLFGVFQRLHRDDEFEGTGIGLANVRRIILRHGGRTWAEGNPGAGATFYFSLPKHPLPNHPSA